MRALLFMALFAAASANAASPGRGVSLAYGYFDLTVDPVDSAGSARYDGCHRIAWRSTDVLGKSDFGTVISTEFGVRGYLLPAEGEYTDAPDSAGNTVTAPADRDGRGLFVFPAAVHAGVTFTPLSTRYLRAGVTGGLGLGISPFPLFFTYVTPHAEFTVVPGLVDAGASFMFAPKGPTDRIEVRNAYRGWSAAVRIAPLWQGLTLDIGYFDDTWVSENADVTYEDRYRAHGLTVGVTLPLN